MLSTKKFVSFLQHECVQAYLDKHGLKAQFGVHKSAENEGVNEYRHIQTSAASDIEKSTSSIEEECRQCYDLVVKKEIRKKSLFMNMSHEVYCIGGYIFNPLSKERSIPNNDWKLDLRSQQFSPIAPVPDGRINFGSAALGGSIYVIGGQSFNNVPFTSVIKYDTYINEWSSLPNLPSPQSWPGVAVDEQGRVIVVGGYSVLVGEPHMSNEAFQYTPGQREWKKLPNLPVAVCNSMTVIDDNVIYTMGGRTLNEKGKVASVPFAFKLKKNAQEWIKVTEIPDYDVKTKGLLFEGGVLSLLDRIVDPKTNELVETKTIKYYKVDDDQWHDGEYVKPSSSQQNTSIDEGPTKEDHVVPVKKSKKKDK